MRSLLAFTVLFSSLHSFGAEPLRDSFGDPLPEGAISRLGTARFRHVLADRITFAPDGKTFVTSGDDGRVCIWDSETGKLRETYRFPYLHVDTNQLSPDGRRYIDFRNHHIEIWDLKKKECTHRLELKDIGYISAVAFSSDENVIATVDDTPRENRIRVWDLKKGTNRVIGATEARVFKLAFVNDSRCLLTHTMIGKFADVTLTAWDTETGEEKWQQRTDSCRFQISSNGRWIAAQKEDDRGLMIWDSKSFEETRLKFPKGKSQFTIGTVSSNGKYCVVLVGNSLWDLEQGKSVLHFGDYFLHDFSPDSKSIVACGSVIQKWDIEKRKPLFSNFIESGHTSIVDYLSWSKDSRLIITGSHGSEIQIWDISKLKQLHRIDRGIYASLVDPCFCSDQRKLHAGISSRVPSLFIAILDNPIKTSEIKVSPNQSSKTIFETLSRSPDEKRAFALAFSGEAKRSLVFEIDLDSNRVIKETETPFSLSQVPFTRRTFSSDARILASEKGLFLIPSLQELPVLQSVKTKPSRPPYVFSKDTHLVAGGYFQVKKVDERSSIGTWTDLTVWERATGKIVVQFPSGPFFGVAFHPSGRYLASSHSDGIRIWDLLTGKQIRFIKGHDEFQGNFGNTYASSLAFSPDGSKLATGHLDTTILIWDMTFLNQPKTPQRDNQTVDNLWKQLLDFDAFVAQSAIGEMTSLGEKIVPFLKEKLHPVQSISAKAFDALLTKLNSDTFRVREQAMKEALFLGDAIEPFLRDTLKRDLTEDQKKRIETLRSKLTWKESPQGEDLRSIRVLRILESIRSPHAIKLIENLGEGLSSARVTEEAKATLERCRYLYR